MTNDERVLLMLLIESHITAVYHLKQLYDSSDDVDAKNRVLEFMFEQEELFTTNPILLKIMNN